jgi:sortase A
MGLICLLWSVVCCSPVEVDLYSVIPTAHVVVQTALPRIIESATEQAGREAPSVEPTATATPSPTATPVPPTHTPSPRPTDTPPPPTDTPLPPTDTPTPAPTATPTPIVLTARVIASALYVREGPGVRHAPIGVVRYGYTFTVLDQDDTGAWLNVCCVDNREGWVSAVHVELAQLEQDAAAEETESAPAVSETSVASVPADVTPSPSAPSEDSLSGEELPAVTEAEPDGAFDPATSVSSLMRIAIPDLGVDAPVVEVGWREEAVDGRLQTVWQVAAYAAGYHRGSGLPGRAGNVVISGHHNIDGEVFRNISLAWDDDQALMQADGVTMRSRVLDGRSIYLYNAEGSQFEYIIQGMYKMPDRDVSQEQRQRNARFIAPTGEPMLTLVTCWPYNTNTHRIVVVARLA